MAPDVHEDVVEGIMRDPLDQGNLEALVAGRHGAPFDVLGLHRLTLKDQVCWIVRVLIPGATAVSLLPAADTKVGEPSTGESGEAHSGALPMKMVDPAGLFSVIGRGELPIQYQPHYRLLIERRPGDAELSYDPYTF